MKTNNPLIILAQSCSYFDNEANLFVYVENRSHDFIVHRFEASDLINSINNSPILAQLSAQKINGKTLEEFINQDIKPGIHYHEHTNKVTLDAITTEKIAEWNAKQAAIAYVPEDLSKKGQADGFASLDSDGKIPMEQMPVIQRANIVVQSIQQMNQLTNEQVFPGMQCIVKDSNDIDPDDQPAVYICKNNTGSAPVWMRIAKLSTDNRVSWDNITDKPTSSTTQIDSAVDKKHEHANKTDVLDKFAVTPENVLTFDGEPILTVTQKIGKLENVVQSNSITDPMSEFYFDPQQVNLAEDRLLGMYFHGLKIDQVEDMTINTDENKITLGSFTLSMDEFIEFEFETFRS